MSKENIENPRLMFEAFNRRDIDGALGYYDPEVEFHPGLLPPDQESGFRGREGVMEWFRGITDVWAAVTAERKETLESPSGEILTFDQWFFRGRDGIEVEEELPTAFAFRDGLIVRVNGFTDRAEALKAVGLNP